MTADKSNWTEADKALIHLIAFEVAEIVLKRHVENCPVWKRIQRAFWWGTGFGAAVAVLGARSLPEIIEWIQSSS